MDVEPAPAKLPTELHMKFGYSIYSARYGNIYTVRQMLQLAEEAFGDRETSSEVWQKGDRYVDPLRPTIEPDGLPSPQAVLAHRARHLERVRQMLLDMDLFIFTMGLTETWIDTRNGTVLPVCPGTVAGEFDETRYVFKNFTFREILKDLEKLRTMLQGKREGKPLRFLLTISPVPLTATATGGNVQVSTVYSKSVLRAVAGEFSDTFEDVDYFPSYEIITSPWSGECFYQSNMRSVSEAGVANVMRTFMNAHGPADSSEKPIEAQPATTKTDTETHIEEDADMMVKCDEELLDAFAVTAK